MASLAKVTAFVKSQRSIHLYKNLQTALIDVLSVLPNETYRNLTKNLIILALHKTALGQAMFFPALKGSFKIIEFVYDKKIPMDVLKYVSAHELGHLMYGQLFPKKGHTWNMLEGKADVWAAKWGFPRNKKIKAWMARKR